MGERLQCCELDRFLMDLNERYHSKLPTVDNVQLLTLPSPIESQCATAIKFFTILRKTQLFKASNLNVKLQIFFSVFLQ